jgi:hypothetical protein
MFANYGNVFTRNNVLYIVLDATNLKRKSGFSRNVINPFKPSSFESAVEENKMFSRHAQATLQR